MCVLNLFYQSLQFSFKNYHNSFLFFRISFDCLGSSGFFKDHWPNLFLLLELLRVKKGMLQSVVGHHWGKLLMSRYKFTRLTMLWNYCCISLLLTCFIDCGLSVCSKLVKSQFSVNHILSKITDISGKCFEDCSGKEKFERKYICWDAVLVSFHRRSHWSGKF